MWELRWSAGRPLVGGRLGIIVGPLLGAVAGLPFGVFGVFFGGVLGRLVGRVVDDNRRLSRLRRFLDGSAAFDDAPTNRVLAWLVVLVSAAQTVGHATDPQVAGSVVAALRSRVAPTEPNIVARWIDDVIALAPDYAFEPVLSHVAGEHRELLHAAVAVIIGSARSAHGLTAGQQAWVARFTAAARLENAGVACEPWVWDVLDLSAEYAAGTVDRAGVKAAYRRLAGHLHPDHCDLNRGDRNRGDRGRDEQAFIRLTEAYQSALQWLTAERPNAASAQGPAPDATRDRSGG